MATPSTSQEGKGQKSIRPIDVQSTVVKSEDSIESKDESVLTESFESPINILSQAAARSPILTRSKAKTVQNFRELDIPLEFSEGETENSGDNLKRKYPKAVDSASCAKKKKNILKLLSRTQHRNMSNSLKVPESEVETKVDIVSKHEQAAQPFEKNLTSMSGDPVPKAEEAQGGLLNQADDMQSSVTYEPMTLNYNEMLPEMIADSSQLSSFGADSLFDTAEAAAFQLPSFTLAMETAEQLKNYNEKYSAALKNYVSNSQTGKNNQSKVLENSTDSKSNKCGASSSGAAEKEIKQSKKKQLYKSNKILESSSSEDGHETESSGKFHIASRKTWSQDDKMCDMLNIVEMITNPVITENSFLSEDSSSASSSCETNNAAANRTDAAEPKDSELGRLHAILEAKGIPLSVFGALGHRMLFQRSMSSASNARVQQLLQGLQADGDEGQQLQAVIEMCQLLVMGNEDTLAGFPVKQVVPVLIKLLEMEHNFEMMNHACRALAYLMEALPRSSSVVIEAIPVLLNKIQVIQCMDVAEQSLTALEMLSKWHNKAVLHAKGIEICLMFFDFFSQNAQRAAFAIIANCCQNILYDEFNLVSNSLPQLSGWLMLSDPKCVESLCLAFSRLVDCMKSQPSHLSEIASHEMLFNVKQLLSLSPCVLSSRTFASVVRMLSQISAASSELSVLLMKQNISETLRFLLIGTSNCDNGIELVPRSAQEMFEIASLICELMPSLPQDGLFAIDSLIAKPKNNKQGSVVWQWRDSTGLWYSYSRNDCKAIESAYLQGKNSLKLGEGKNSSWTIDLHTMQQHNEDSSFIRPVRRYINVSEAASCLENEKNDLPKVDHFKENADLVASCIKELFPILYEVYSSSSEPAVKHKCLATIVRMIYFAPSNILELVLNNQLVAKHIAALLASPDFRLVKKALQISEILMEKLPSVFGVHFIREGVIYEIKALVDKDFNFETQDSSSFTSSFLKSYPQISASNASLEYSLAATRARNSVRVAGTEVAASSEKLVRDDGPSSSKSSKVTYVKKTDLIPKQFDSCCKEAHTTHRSSLPLNSELKKKVGTWIKEQAKSFKEKFFSVEKLLSLDPAINVLNQLTSAANELAAVDCGALRALEIIRDIITDSDISSFELIHSGLINKLFEYLTASTDADVIKHSKEDNLKYFLHVFIGSPLSSASDFKEKHLNSSPLFALVSKLNACVSHLEQFPVDQPYNVLSGKQGTNSFRIFNMGQFKCLFQRHHSCSNLRQWHNGPVMIEPLALIYNINRYLENRGYAVLQNDKDSVYDEVDDDLSDPSFEDSSDEEVGSIVVRVEEERRAPKLQFLIGNNVLPYDMTIYRAIRQYGYIENINNDGQEFDSESVLSTSDMWLRTYTIWYRPVPLESEENVDETKITTRSKSDKKKTSSSRNSKKAASERETVVKVEKDPLWDDGIVPEVASSSLISNLHKTDLTQDPSLDVMYLLKVIHYLNCHWGFIYQMSSWGPAVSNTVFINSKLTGKVNQQLQDPFAIMTGNVPSWLSQIAYKFPFLFPFETRHLLFYVNSFDRDRALQRLFDTFPSFKNNGRISPKLDKRKKTVSRDSLLKQAESLFKDLGNSKAVLEIQYKNEVGTGLGPTLEFYALISKELQRADLDMWRGEKVMENQSSVNYIYNPLGLYPVPLPRNTKTQLLTRICSKFKLLGNIFAKALMDSRLLDIPLSLAFYKWMLNEECYLTVSDLKYVDESLLNIITKLEHLVVKKKHIENDEALSAIDKKVVLESLTYDGCPLDDLNLDFTLPGYAHIEMKKNGKETMVSIHNLEEYLKLLKHWILYEGVQLQMKAFRDGFESVFPLSHLKIFYPDELELLFCGTDKNQWDMESLMACCRLDHGYDSESQAIKFLFEILCSYNVQQQRQFLKFVTGSPRLPVGGLKSLCPPLTIVRKTSDDSDSDSYLPSVMTCVNYLKLPAYSTREIMRTKLELAISEGQHSFHLS